MPAEEPRAPTAPSSQLANSNHLRQRRARSQLSCIPCRNGKLKCNRSHEPACDQCIKRSREGSCVYVPAPQKQKPAQNVKGRIRQLESLVIDLMQKQNAQAGSANEDQDDEDDEPVPNARRGQGEPFTEPTPPSDNDVSFQNNDTPDDDDADDLDGASKPFGRMRISKDEISYVGDSHWRAILEGISELKRDLGDDEDNDEDMCSEQERSWRTGAAGAVPEPGSNATTSQTDTGVGFLMGNTNDVSREQLLAQIPEKRHVDRLLSLWFNSPDPFKPIIHGPTFQEEYRQFWQAPESAPTMWLGLLYAIMSLASSFGLRDCDPSMPAAQKIRAEVDKFHSLAASAAVLADFTKPKQYTLECLILYSAGLRSNDAFVNVWLMIGLAVRLALRMGYHRDPSNYPRISTFHGEMRRRVWAIISMIDVLISFQIGLPSMVKTIQFDTQPPRNLLDRDFNINTKVLPPNRGPDELTPSSYTRAKLLITRIFADATDISHATIPPPYEEVMQLDRRLEEGKAAIPPLLQMPEFSELVTDPAEQLMCRFNLNLLYLKTKIVLHRRYMEVPFAGLSTEEQQKGIGYSRLTCVNCALQVLRHHHTIYTASQAGGQLESVKWYMGSISTHDFLLAAMVICLELSQQIRKDSAVMSPGGKQCPQQAALLDALEKSQQIWSEASGRRKVPVQFTGRDHLAKGEHMFDETEKASKAMAVMLQKVKSAACPLTTQGITATVDTPPQASNGTAGRTNGFAPLSHLQRPDSTLEFGGMVSNHLWRDVPEVTGGFDMSHPGLAGSTYPRDLAPGLVNESYSQSTSQGDSPNDAQFLGFQPDFTAIGDMLDIQGNVDWTLFDDQIVKSQRPQWPPTHPAAPMQPGNVALGGMEQLSAPTGRSSSGTSPENPVYPGSWMTFQEMNQTDYSNIDIPMDINGNVLWPAHANGMPTQI